MSPEETQWVLIGPNGAGKTTFINCMTGFQRPSGGSVRVGDEEATDWSPQKFRKMGIARTFQAGRLFREMTVLENLEVTAAGMGRKRRESQRLAAEMLDRMGLAAKAGTIAGALPYTDERRIGIARALILSPAFLLVDEPAAGMSDSECDELVNLLSALPAEYGCGVILIEHNVRVVMETCRRIHVLDSGRSIAEGTPEDIRSNKEVISAYLGDHSVTRRIC